MPLIITKLSAKCDVLHCDKQAEATLERLKSLGWSSRFLRDNVPTIDILTPQSINYNGLYRVVCPRCSIAGHYKKMELPT